jgi:hypothetical protein
MFHLLSQIELFFTSDFRDGFSNLLILLELASDVRTIFEELVLILPSAFLLNLDFIF